MIEVLQKGQFYLVSFQRVRQRVIVCLERSRKAPKVPDKKYQGLLCRGPVDTQHREGLGLFEVEGPPLSADGRGRPY